MQPVVHEGHLNGQGFRFAIVASRWNDFISARLVEGALDALERLGADEKLVEVYKVPGAFEIPLLALKLAASGKFDAIICVGTIIRGQTPHFEYIAGEVASGIAQAALQTGVPVVFGSPIGHTKRPMLTLPLGVRARLNAAGEGKLQILESAVQRKTLSRRA